MPREVFPLPVESASEVEAFAPAWALGHAESEVGLALVSAAHHVKLQGWISAAGLNWLGCSCVHRVTVWRTKVILKDLYFSPGCLNVTSSWRTKVSSRSQISAIFPSYSLLPFLSFLWGYPKSTPTPSSPPPAHWAPLPNFLTPLVCLSIHELLFFALLILAFLARSQTSAPSWSLLLARSHTHPWEM